MEKQLFSQSDMWAEVLLPLAVPTIYTYSVPVEYTAEMKIGIRVEVPLRNKRYAGVVKQILSEELKENCRPIISVIDVEPIVTKEQLKLWGWMSDYYCCTIGEVMNVALPSGLKLNSETKILLNPFNDEVDKNFKNKKEYLLFEALNHQDELTINDLQKLLKQKSVYPFIKKQLALKRVYIKEELLSKYKPKKIDFVRLEDKWFIEPNIDKAFGLVSRSPKQNETLLCVYEQHDIYEWIPKHILYKKVDINNSVIKSLQKKGLIKIVNKQIDRINLKGTDNTVQKTLSPVQQKSQEKIDDIFKTKDVILFHGVTGSGKTEIYIEQIKNVIEEGGQVLYLLPEIALTSQMLSRMQHAFGKEVIFYHSRMSVPEQVEVWYKVLQGHSIVLGARSSVFLPFINLKLLIVDEEHDSSYKQQDPNPRYNARDVSVYMSSLHQAKAILGTATPSLESLHNKISKKYGYVKLDKRHGGAVLPEIRLIDLTEEAKATKGQLIFSEGLIEATRHRVSDGEQVLLFQNRRGYAPTLRCFKCNWHMECPNCDVSLTTHQYNEEMRCHYCGYRTPTIKTCPSCGNRDIRLIGFGTEKVEDILSEFIPDINIKRMDHDTMRKKDSYNKIIHQMKTGEIDVLIGTQMVTKGLDFDRINLVGVLHADALFSFPDFRAGEKAFQLLTQVSGRAGRQGADAEVIIQTYDTQHWIIEHVINYDFSSFSSRELSERQAFKYPPFYRIINVTIRHKVRSVASQSAQLLAHNLKKELGKRVLGPAIPQVARINNQYYFYIMIKLEKDNKLIKNAKQFIVNTRAELLKLKGYSSVRIALNIDPY